MDGLPAGYDAWRTRTPQDDERDHLDACPQNEDAERAFECGGYAEHFCTLAAREINGCELVPAGDCTCPTPDELKAEEAEARYDAQREGA